MHGGSSCPGCTQHMQPHSCRCASRAAFPPAHRGCRLRARRRRCQPWRTLGCCRPLWCPWALGRRPLHPGRCRRSCRRCGRHWEPSPPWKSAAPSPQASCGGWEGQRLAGRQAAGAARQAATVARSVQAVKHVLAPLAASSNRQLLRRRQLRYGVQALTWRRRPCYCRCRCRCHRRRASPCVDPAGRQWVGRNVGKGLQLRRAGRVPARHGWHGSGCGMLQLTVQLRPPHPACVPA